MGASMLEALALIDLTELVADRDSGRLDELLGDLERPADAVARAEQLGLRADRTALPTATR